MSRTIRLALPADAAAIAAIYAPFCADTSITFETVALSPVGMAERMRVLGEKYPWLVMDVEGVVAGYAYAAPYHERAAFLWSAVVSVYIDQRHRRTGVGRDLYQSLFAVLRMQGFVHAIAGITLPNEPSVRLHESFGFKLVGVYPQIGFKLGDWRDVSWWQLALMDPLPSDPQKPVAMAAVVEKPEFSAVIGQAF